jgi:hypothetical protein
MNSLVVSRVAPALALIPFLASAALAAPGDTRVANWKDDKKSAFLIMLDDSVETDLSNAIPSLQKRGLTATFYINPGLNHYKKHADEWENQVSKMPGVVLGNHTMMHDGLKDYDSADADLKQVDAIINRVQPGKQPHLISFAKPGVSKDKWTITDEDYKKVLATNNLIPREIPGLNASQFNNLKTTEGMLAIVDKGIEQGVAKAILFHGIGGDWLATPMEVWNPFLDGLVERQDKVWITDHISAHKYETERKVAKVSTLSSDAKSIKLDLKSDTDPQLYDYPLTLVTKVPANWKSVTLTQGDKKSTATPADGHVMFEAVPNGAVITLQP